MRQIRITSVIIVVALAVAALSQTVFASDNQAETRFTLTVNDTQGTVAPPDFFDKPQANAQGSEDAPVSRNGQVVGLAETVYTVTRVHDDDVAVMVECSIELPEGNILFNGAVHLADVGTGAVVPVVGGTGQYAGTSGTVVMVGMADGNTSLNFDMVSAESSSGPVGMPRTGNTGGLTILWLLLILAGVLLATGWSFHKRSVRL